MRAEHASSHVKVDSRPALLTKIQAAIEDVEKTQTKLQALTRYSARDARKYFKIDIKTNEVQPYLQEKIREFGLLKLQLQKVERRLQSGQVPTQQATGLPHALEMEDAALEAELEQLCQMESPLQSPANRHASEPDPLSTPPQRTRLASESRDIQQRLRRDQLQRSPDSPRIASNPARTFEETSRLFMAAKHEQFRMSGEQLQAAAQSQAQSHTPPEQRSSGTQPKA